MKSFPSLKGGEWILLVSGVFLGNALGFCFFKKGFGGGADFGEVGAGHHVAAGLRFLSD